MRRLRLAGVKRWGYQLRLINFQEVAASPTDLVVLDHALSNGLDFVHQFEPWHIAHVKTAPDGRRRTVLAYLSIGEAERYRFYWKPAWFEAATTPAWLGAMNPQWFGNYPVRYWDPAWQRLIVGGADAYLDRIIAQGFDGIYLDRADVFAEVGRLHPTPRKAMASFIAAIASAARRRDPNFLIVMQNAEELIAHAPVRDAIDGIAKEDLYYGVDHSEAANAPDLVAAAERDLLVAKAAGKRIFVVEYLTDAAKIARVQERCAKLGFVATFAPRLLGALITDSHVLVKGYRGPLVPQE